MDDTIDSALLKQIAECPRKVALVLSRCAEALGVDGCETDYESIAQRLYRLVEDGHIESAGDVSNWRGSEVWLRPGSNRRIEA